MDSVLPKANPLLVITEGRSEVGGGWHERYPLKPIPEDRLGALEILVKRVAKEVYRRNVQLIALTELRRHQIGKSGKIALTEAITDPEQLRKLLVAFFKAVPRSVQVYAAGAAVVACDSDKAEKVGAALQQALQSVDGPVAHLVFEPEFEILFFDKSAVETAKGLSRCCLGNPPGENTMKRRLSAKEALKKWLDCYCVPDSRFFTEVARELSLGGARPALNKFCQGIGGLFRQKRGRP